jgi:hypothetical protein
MKTLSLCCRAGYRKRRASRSDEIDLSILHLNVFEDLRNHCDSMCLHGCQIFWVEREEFVDLSVTSNQSEMPGFRASSLVR